MDDVAGAASRPNRAGLPRRNGPYLMTWEPTTAKPPSLQMTWGGLCFLIGKDAWRCRWMFDGDIVFRTAPLLALTSSFWQVRGSIEVNAPDEALTEVRSALVNGEAHGIVDPAEHRQVEHWALRCGQVTTGTSVSALLPVR